MTSTIRYFNHFTHEKGDADIKTITSDELDKQNTNFFDQGFNEVLSTSGLHRLYFDIELNEYIDDDWLEIVIIWLNELAEKLKTTYKACGYTKSEKIIKQYNTNDKVKQQLMLEYKQDSSIEHVVSFHVYFKKVFETKDIFKVFNGYKDFLLIQEGVDLNVYKREGVNQYLRHPFAKKIWNDYKAINTNIDFTKFENPFKASDLVATSDGTEAKGSYQELYDVLVDDLEVQIKHYKTKDEQKIDIGFVDNSEKFKVDDTMMEWFTIILKGVCDKEFKRDQTLHDIVAFLPRSRNNGFIEIPFLKAYTKLYDAVPHNTPENIEKLHDELKHCNGFCTCMSNILNKYYEKNDYKKLQKLKNLMKAEKYDEMTEKDKLKLAAYSEFEDAHKKIVEFYFKYYDYVHTTANEKKFLQRRYNCDKCHTKIYAECYLRKILYICGKQYYYRKELYKTEKESLTDNAFKTSLKAIFNVNNIDERFNSKLKIFHSEDLLETHDGLVYPRYRDLDYDMCLTTDEFNTFITAYKSTFKDQCCADFAVKILIQDIASGFHDNSSIIKFYYGTGGNNKDCESCIYENIVCDHDLVFKTSNFEVLADEKNIKVVSSLYVQFNEMPANNKDKFNVFINALKNYNEQGKQTTRGLFENFTTINTNIRFQCNTNNPALRDWLLDNANDAIKRRFFVAERVHNDQWSDWLYEFTHDENKCKALKMYIKNNKFELYNEKLNSMSVLQFYKDNADIYVKYIEAKADDEFEELKEALCCSGCVKGKRDANSEDEFTVKIRDWYHEYVGENKKKCSESTFRSKVNQYIAYVKHCYVDGKRTANKYFITNNELIQALNNYTNAHTSVDTSAVDES